MNASYCSTAAKLNFTVYNNVLQIRNVNFLFTATVSQGETIEGIEFEKKTIISTDVRTEWKTYQQMINNAQLVEFTTNDNVATQPTQISCHPPIPVGMGSVERLFSQVKPISTTCRLQSSIGELSLYIT